MPAGSLRWMSLPGRWSSRHWDLEHFTWMLRRYYGFHSSAPRLAGLQCSSLIQRAHPGGFMTPNDESSMWIGRQARRPKCLWKALCTVAFYPSMYDFTQSFVDCCSYVETNKSWQVLLTSVWIHYVACGECEYMYSSWPWVTYYVNDISWFLAIWEVYDCF